MSAVNAQALWQANALWAGAAIASRLKANVPALREVLLMDDIDSASAAGPKQFPAALVMLHAMQPTGTRPEGATQTPLEQQWMVAIAVQNVRAAADRSTQAAGPVIPAVVAALQGWQPGGQPRALAWRPGPGVNYGATVTYYPCSPLHELPRAPSRAESTSQLPAGAPLGHRRIWRQRQCMPPPCSA